MVAKAKIKTTTTETVVLKLTRKEAEYLRTLLRGCVVGMGPVREVNRRIECALLNAGVWALPVPEPGDYINVTNWKL